MLSLYINKQHNIFLPVIMVALLYVLTIRPAIAVINLIDPGISEPITYTTDQNLPHTINNTGDNLKVIFGAGINNISPGEEMRGLFYKIYLAGATFEDTPAAFNSALSVQLADLSGYATLDFISGAGSSKLIFVLHGDGNTSVNPLKSSILIIPSITLTANENVTIRAEVEYWDGTKSVTGEDSGTLVNFIDPVPPVSASLPTAPLALFLSLLLVGGFAFRSRNL
ncbi:hypothetical protein QUF61_15140 [Candidatus Venteria ishoeyi]|uniref:hypothetical protein n=1 Tax=Candidatus Venteria ishoeyi TaxID=1899563 RepID=UPI0025A55E00|nr:hypothetical protein [Candidatus Venteria ishoeyi]MDM8547825.1 hypothetical protein [Candidatus Venteria ishoeyi]